MNNMINKIAADIITDTGSNVLDDYYDFYEDCSWSIECLRNLQKCVNKLMNNITLYNTYIPQIEQNINYLSDTSFQMNNSTHNELKNFLQKIKQAYNNYEQAENEQDKMQFHKKYLSIVKNEKNLIDSYEKSYVNIFRNKYKEDEENVSNLLNSIRENANKILNTKIQQ